MKHWTCYCILFVDKIQTGSLNSSCFLCPDHRTCTPYFKYHSGFIAGTLTPPVLLHFVSSSPLCPAPRWLCYFQTGCLCGSYCSRTFLFRFSQLVLWRSSCKRHMEGLRGHDLRCLSLHFLLLWLAPEVSVWRTSCWTGLAWPFRMGRLLPSAERPVTWELFSWCVESSFSSATVWVGLYFSLDSRLWILLDP